MTQIKSSDTFGIFKDPTIDNEKKTITIDTDSSVSLSKDSTVDLMGNMKFKVTDSDILRFYPMVEYEILAEGVTPHTNTRRRNSDCNNTRQDTSSQRNCDSASCK